MVVNQAPHTRQTVMGPVQSALRITTPISSRLVLGMERNVWGSFCICAPSETPCRTIVIIDKLRCEAVRAAPCPLLLALRCARNKLWTPSVCL